MSPMPSARALVSQKSMPSQTMFAMRVPAPTTIKTQLRRPYDSGRYVRVEPRKSLLSPDVSQTFHRTSDVLASACRTPTVVAYEASSALHFFFDTHTPAVCEEPKFYHRPLPFLLLFSLLQTPSCSHDVCRCADHAPKSNRGMTRG